MGAVEDRLDALGVHGLGAALFRRLVDHFGTWQAARAASIGDLTHVSGVGPSLARAICGRERDLDPGTELAAPGIRNAPVQKTGWQANHNRPA